jgi:ABC-type siderophore export system fused ATPase/permease subunit
MVAFIIAFMLPIITLFLFGYPSFTIKGNKKTSDNTEERIEAERRRMMDEVKELDIQQEARKRYFEEEIMYKDRNKKGLVSLQREIGE